MNNDAGENEDIKNNIGLPYVLFSPELFSFFN